MVLQIQMRDLPGFLETRQALLELKSANKHNCGSPCYAALPLHRTFALLGDKPCMHVHGCRTTMNVLQPPAPATAASA